MEVLLGYIMGCDIPESLKVTEKHYGFTLNFMKSAFIMLMKSACTYCFVKVLLLCQDIKGMWEKQFSCFFHCQIFSYREVALSCS